MKKILSAILLSALIVPAAAQAEYVLTQQIGFEAADTYDEAGFDRDGVHQETQTTEDPEGYTAAGNQAPVINSFTASPANGDAPLNVTFTVDATDDVGTPAVSINYGDGSSGTSLSHTYSEGSYTATLTVTDEKGLSDTMSSGQITATNPLDCQYKLNAPGNYFFQRNDQYNMTRVYWQGNIVAEGTKNQTSLYAGGYTYQRGNQMLSMHGNEYYTVCR